MKNRPVRPLYQVEVSNRQNDYVLCLEQYHALVQRVLAYLKIPAAEISVQFVDNPTIARLNWQHLQHEGPTDIITFPLSPPDSDQIEGELVISVPWASHTAAANGDQLEDELNLYLIHGLLHLLGQDDISQEDAQKMKFREYEILNALELTIPKCRFEFLGG